MSNDIDIKEFKERRSKKEDINLIDVREEWEYEEFNIGGRLIPLNSLPSRLEELRDLQDEEVIVHCRSGNRSAQAKMFLESRGFQNVRNLAGGLVAFQEEG